MAGKQERRVRRKLKKNHAWISLIIFTLISALAGFMMWVAMVTFIHYIIDSKLLSENEAIKYMARLYEKGGDNEDIYELLNEEGREYIIKDEDGTVIYSYGENTCSDEGDEVYLALSYIDDEDNSLNRAYIYKDTNNGYIYAGKYNSVVVDYKGLLRELQNNRKLIAQFNEMVENQDDEVTISDSAGMFYISSYNVSMRIPVWMQVDTDGTSFIGKAFLRIDMEDFAHFVILGLLMFVIAFLICIVMFVSVINGIVSQRRMLKLFFTDLVTKGHNWMWFLYKGEHLLRRRSSARTEYAVLNMVFVKYRNYCVCHSITEGEKMLKKVYEVTNKHLERKEMLAHVSNSNFALLLRYEDKDQLKARIEELISELSRIDSDHVFSFQVGVDTVGVCRNGRDRIIRRKNVDLELEYNNACTARATLAENDEAGVAFFDEKLVEDQKWIDKVTERQRYALEHEEFVVYYQPKYDPSTDRLKGAEALIRWQSDDMGFVPPGRFIPIFEKNGFITEIDHYMLEHVARDQKAWLDQGYECVPVSVNVSRAHFIESDLAEQIRDIVDKAGTPHKYIEIELTESAFFDDKKALVSTILRLKEYGFSVSMDDFGSGYSSLNSLKDMPLDVLKLDAEFFRGDAHGNRGEIVVSEAIRLAKSLNMRTVAEGVEVKEQVDFLAEQGCDMIQGYYYAKPMPKEDYEQRMNSGE